MSNRIKNNLKNLVGQTLNQYYSKVKPTISDLRYKQEYQNRIIDCMVGEVDDNYIETPETDSAIVKLEHSKEGLVKVSSIKGKTILVDADGNETDTPGEGCRLVSVGEDEDNKMIILSKNKNLFNKDDKTYYGYYQNYNGDYWSLSPNPNYNGFMIPVKPSTQYTFNKQVYCVEYNKDKETLRILRNTKFTTSENTYYIGFSRSVNEDLSDLQFEMNNTSTVYESYRYHKTEILLDEPLRSLPNGVCDEVIGNQLIKRLKKVILNGSENWKMSGQSPSLSYSLDIDSTLSQPITVSKLMCATDEICGETSLYNGTKYGLGYKNSNNTIRLRREGISSLEELKQSLSETPLEFYYETLEPIIEELPNGIALQGFDDTTMYIENSITPIVQYGYNALIPYKEELNTQKEEVETNTLDIEQNIIPYLMDMEFNLMLMEDNE